MTKAIKATTIIVFACVALFILGLLVFPAPWNQKRTRNDSQNRIVIPESIDFEELIGESLNESAALEDQMNVKVPLNEGEIVAAVLTEDFDGDFEDEQFVAYRNLLEAENPVYLTYIDSASGVYRQVWSAPTAASRPGTISIYTQDMAGDRSLCVLVSGMNAKDEHTLTVFKKNPPAAADGGAAVFDKIAELNIDGSIQVRETARSQAYQMGVASGVSFPIAAYGRDYGSSNIMDQLEYIYTYNANTGLYEQSRITKVPGIQIEQRRVQELLGNRAAFEDFITGLWYYVNAAGTIDSRQYIYFDPKNREIIFYGDETQQVFTWQNSSASRFGLHITSQNISVSTLRRSVDIELESLESIRIKVFEDVRMRIGVNAPWDGSYRKADPLNPGGGNARESSSIDGLYDSAMGRIRFSPDGNYEILAEGSARRGKYVLFYLGTDEILELRPEKTGTPGAASPGGADEANTAAMFARGTYLVEKDAAAYESETVVTETPGGETAAEGTTKTDSVDNGRRKTFSISRIRLGVRGIERLYEGTITLTLVEE